MTDVDFTQLAIIASNGGQYFSGDTEITLTNNHMLISNPIAGWTNQLVAITNECIVFVGRESNQTTRLYLDGGVLDGRLTLVSEDDILIRSHTRYFGSASFFTPPPDDSLGLIAKDDVWISTFAPDDLDVHASIIAAGQQEAFGDRGNFGVTSYNSHVNGPRGTLTIFESVAQDQIYPKETYNSRTGITKTGYASVYRYDPRLETTPPPHYPRLLDKVELSGWSYPE
ncbi:MAG: hypothetical protein ACI9QL_001211 [Candidatus Omnitrophota bacterium]|jgi:hypothetical protein